MQNEIKSAKGFVFTFEAILALLLFALMLFTIHEEKDMNFKELIITQQANDLLRVWSQKYPTENEMMTDIKSVFENNAGIKINEKEILKCDGSNKLATEGIILNEFLKENKIIITVCYN